MSGLNAPQSHVASQAEKESPVIGCEIVALSEDGEPRCAVITESPFPKEGQAVMFDGVKYIITVVDAVDIYRTLEAK